MGPLRRRHAHILPRSLPQTLDGGCRSCLLGGRCSHNLRRRRLSALRRCYPYNFRSRGLRFLCSRRPHDLRRRRLSALRRCYPYNFRRRGSCLLRGRGSHDLRRGSARFLCSCRSHNFRSRSLRFLCSRRPYDFCCRRPRLLRGGRSHNFRSRSLRFLRGRGPRILRRRRLSALRRGGLRFLRRRGPYDFCCRHLSVLCRCCPRLLRRCHLSALRRRRSHDFCRGGVGPLRRRQAHIFPRSLPQTLDGGRRSCSLCSRRPHNFRRRRPRLLRRCHLSTLRRRHRTARRGGHDCTLRRRDHDRRSGLRRLFRHREFDGRHFFTQPFIDDLDLQRVVAGRQIQHIEVNFIRRFEDPLDLFAVEARHHTEHFRLAFHLYLDAAVFAQLIARFQTFDDALGFERGYREIHRLFARLARRLVFHRHRDRMFARWQVARIQLNLSLNGDIRPIVEAVATQQRTARLGFDEGQIQLGRFLQQIATFQALELKHRRQRGYLKGQLLAGRLIRLIGDDEFHIVQPGVEIIGIQRQPDLFFQAGFRYPIDHDLGGREARLPTDRYRDLRGLRQHRLLQQGAGHGDFRRQSSHGKWLGDLRGISIDIARRDRQLIWAGGHLHRHHRGAIGACFHDGFYGHAIQLEDHLCQGIIGSDGEGKAGRFPDRSKGQFHQRGDVGDGDRCAHVTQRRCDPPRGRFQLDRERIPIAIQRQIGFDGQDVLPAEEGSEALIQRFQLLRGGRFRKCAITGRGKILQVIPIELVITQPDGVHRHTAVGCRGARILSLRAADSTVFMAIAEDDHGTPRRRCIRRQLHRFQTGLIQSGSPTRQQISDRGPQCSLIGREIQNVLGVRIEVDQGHHRIVADEVDEGIGGLFERVQRETKHAAARIQRQHHREIQVVISDVLDIDEPPQFGNLTRNRKLTGRQIGDRTAQSIRNADRHIQLGQFQRVDPMNLQHGRFTDTHPLVLCEARHKAKQAQ